MSAQQHHICWWCLNNSCKSWPVLPSWRLTSHDVCLLLLPIVVNH
jgi:hypothetical protein